MILYCQGKYKWRITLIIIHNSIIIAVNLHYFFYRYIENPGKARAACFLRNTDTQIANSIALLLYYKQMIKRGELFAHRFLTTKL